MSRLAIAIAILTILHSYVSAQAPSCISGYADWSFNTKHQSPCTMAVALGGVCATNGVFTLDQLQPDYVYLGPTQLNANSCRCSTVFYSVLSACAYCQNRTYLDWTIYDVNCTTVYVQTAHSTFDCDPSLCLFGCSGDSFDVNAAESAGGPESTPVPGATSSTAASTATSVASTSTGKKVNIGAIAGGAAGGVVLIGIIAGLTAFIIMRRRKASVSTPSTYTSYGSPQTMTNDVRYNSTGTTTTSGRIYDPNDPTTFPSNFPFNPVRYNNYSGSPPGVTTTITGTTTHSGVPVPAHTQYTGAPEPQDHIL